MKSREARNSGKKLFLAGLLLFGLASFGANAQNNEQPMSVNLGLTLGGNYGNLSSNLGSFNGGVSYQAAANAEWRFNNHQFGIAVEGQYISLNTNSNYQDSLVYYNKTLRINYNTNLIINYGQVALYFKYYIPLGSKPIIPYDRPEGDGNYLTLFGGPYMSFVSSASNTGHIKLTSHYVDTASHDVVVDSILTKGDSNSIHTADGLALSVIGATIGAGVNLRLAKGLELTFDIRYSQDLTSLDAPYKNYGFLGHRYIVATGKDAGLYYTDSNVFTNFIAFNVGLNIRLFEFGG